MHIHYSRGPPLSYAGDATGTRNTRIKSLYKIVHEEAMGCLTVNTVVVGLAPFVRN